MRQSKLLTTVLAVLLCVPLTHTIASNADSGFGSRRAILTVTNDGTNVFSNPTNAFTSTMAQDVPNTNRTNLFAKVSQSSMRNTTISFFPQQISAEWNLREKPLGSTLFVTRAEKRESSFFSAHFSARRELDDKFYRTTHHPKFSLDSISPVRLVSNVTHSMKIFTPAIFHDPLGKMKSNLNPFKYEIADSPGLFRFVSGGETAKQPSRITAGVLAVIPITGCLGVHKYYLGSWGWGLTYTGAVVCTSGFGAFVTWIVSLIEGIGYFGMSDAAFAAKYSPQTRRAFRW